MPKRQLKDVQVTHVSFVDKGANQKTFFLTKSAEEDVDKAVNKTISPITKTDDVQKIVYGVVYEPDIEDAHGDFMTAGEIEKSAHYFLAEHRKIDKQHNFSEGYGSVVESYIAPSDMSIGEEEIRKGSWIMAVKASDEVWDEIQKGSITGFSLAGTAIVEEVEKSTRETYEGSFTERNIFSLLNSFSDAIGEIVWDEREPDISTFNKIMEEAKEFIQIVEEIEAQGEAEGILKSQRAEFEKENNVWVLEELKEGINSIINNKEGTK